MVNEQTIQRLKEMSLDTMAENLRSQSGDVAFNALSFDERLGLLVDAEWSTRRSRKLVRITRSAGLHFPYACIEDIEYHADRKLDKAVEVHAQWWKNKREE
jgi:hypothetical protein